LTYRTCLILLIPVFRYEILNDPDTRAAYDLRGMAGIGGNGNPGMDPADLFAFFAGAHPVFGFDFGPDMGRRSGKGEDSVIPYDVTLEDLYNGKSVKVNMEKDVICTQCKGYV